MALTKLGLEKLVLANAERFAVALLRFIRHAESELANREGGKRLRGEDLVGLPGYTLARGATRKRHLSLSEAQRLDQSPIGSAILRAAARPGAPAKTLRDDKNPEKMHVLTRWSAGHNYARDAEEFLVEYVHQTMGHWYFEDVATLLGIGDPVLLEKRSRDYRKRRSYGPKLLAQSHPGP